MSSLDGQPLFDSGPHDIRPGPWQRSVQRRGFAGVDGETVLDMGMRSRTIAQDGRLTAATAGDLDTLITDIEALVDGQLHTLIDNHSRTFSRVLIEQFETSTPIRKGRDYWCEYTVLYRQMP